MGDRLDRKRRERLGLDVPGPEPPGPLYVEGTTLPGRLQVSELRTSARARRKSRARANSTVMAHETRFERRLDRALARATTPRGAVVVIASATTAITLGAALLMTVVDQDNFPSVGSGLWWAIQTITTVGYGDDVPTTVAGQLVAALVMLLGIAFLSVITAAITSTFVSRPRPEQGPAAADTAPEELRQMREQLDRIEAALTTGR